MKTPPHLKNQLVPYLLYKAIFRITLQVVAAGVAAAVVDVVVVVDHIVSLSLQETSFNLQLHLQLLQPVPIKKLLGVIIDRGHVAANDPQLLLEKLIGCCCFYHLPISAVTGKKGRSRFFSDDNWGLTPLAI